MTQRDRLAALLRDTEPFDYDPADWADALLARGVRVVDEMVERIEARIAATGRSATTIARDQVIAIIREEAAR